MNAFKIHKESPAITLIGRGEYAEDIPYDRRIFWDELKNCKNVETSGRHMAETNIKLIQKKK